jgi:HEAT repeat protein
MILPVQVRQNLFNQFSENHKEILGECEELYFFLTTAKQDLKIIIKQLKSNSPEIRDGAYNLLLDFINKNNLVASNWNNLGQPGGHYYD